MKREDRRTVEISRERREEDVGRGLNEVEVRGKGEEKGRGEEVERYKERRKRKGRYGETTKGKGRVV